MVLQVNANCGIWYVKQCEKHGMLGTLYVWSYVCGSRCMCGQLYEGSVVYEVSDIWG